MTSSNQILTTETQADQTPIQVAEQRPSTTETLFPEARKLETCSFNECIAGHKFPLSIAIARCPGCQQPILAVKMVQCPICNEPVSKAQIRTDHMPHGGAITRACYGDVSNSEVGLIELIRKHSSEAEADLTEREMIGKL